MRPDSSQYGGITALHSVGKRTDSGGSRVAQMFNYLTLDFGSGHSLNVMGSSPASGLVLGMESA